MSEKNSNKHHEDSEDLKKEVKGEDHVINGVENHEEQVDSNDKEEQDDDAAVQEVNAKLEEAVQKVAEMTDKYARLSAEFDNYRKRTIKENIENSKRAGEDLLKDILPVMDNFERALKSMEDSTDIDAVKQGVDLIYKQFKSFLEKNGVKEIESMGQPFDTDEHEAITEIPAPSDDMKGKVLDCVQKGYRMHDKVIRFAKVVVGKK